MKVKSYKYRVYPTPEQQEKLTQQFGCVRWVYNWGLETRIKAYTVDKVTLTFFKLVTRLPLLKEEFPWLKECNAQSLQMALRNLDNAFTGFFRKNCRFPQFRKRSNTSTVHYPQRVSLNFETHLVSIPKIGKVRAILHRPFKGRVKTCTIQRRPSGKFYLLVRVETETIVNVEKPINTVSSIGIDLGLKTFVTLSTNEKIDKPKNDRLQTHLQILCHRRDKKQTGSANYERARIRAARAAEQIQFRSLDFLHKLTHRLTHENQVDTLVIEDLAVGNLRRSRRLGSSIEKASWYEFRRQLTYKCDWYGKNLIVIGRFDPSSKLCSSCGAINRNLMLAERVWTCSCGAQHDRDVNAAINIKNFGLLKGRPETPSDRGEVPVESLIPTQDMDLGQISSMKQEK